MTLDFFTEPLPPSPFFGHGFICGQLHQRMLGPERFIQATVPVEVRTAIESLATAQDWTQEFEPTPDGQLSVTLHSPADRRRASGYFWAQRNGSEHVEVLSWANGEWWLAGSIEPLPEYAVRVLGPAEPPELDGADPRAP